MIKDRLLEQANAVADDARGAIVITVPAEGAPQISLVGVTLPGALKLLGLFVVELAGKLTIIKKD